MRDGRRRDLTLAWHTAALARQKRLPLLHLLLDGDAPKPVAEADKTDWQRELDERVARERKAAHVRAD